MLTGKEEEVSKFSTSTHEFHKAVLEVPDHRLTQLAEFNRTPPVYARIEFLDTGAVAFRESKNTTFIDLLRRADGLIHLVRGFEDPEILHTEGSVDPGRDIRAMEEELITLDFIAVEKRLEKLTADVGKIKSTALKEELEMFKLLKSFLEEGNPLREYNFNAKEESMIKGFTLLSLKPLITIVNADENTYEKYLELEQSPGKDTRTMVFCGKIEMELLELDVEDREVFQEEYGLKDYTYMRENFIRACYKLMNLISFFTIGKNETKAWPVKRSDTAYEAAGKVHTDIQQGFIRAETIDWKDFLDAKGFHGAKEKGLLRLEGKEYLVKDGEILQFRFNK